MDVAKDVVYIEAPDSKKRRSMQTVLYDVVVRLTKLMTPILPHTTEEIWKYLKEDEEYAQLSEMPEVKHFNNEEKLVIFMNIFVAGLNAFFLAAFSQVITALVMRYTEVGFDLKYQVQILSNDLLDEIKETLLKDNSSLTLYDVVGGYSQTQKQQILLIVDRQDYGHLIAKIHEIDPEAFIVTSNVTKVHGGKWGL